MHNLTAAPVVVNGVALPPLPPAMRLAVDAAGRLVGPVADLADSDIVVPPDVARALAAVRPGPGTETIEAYVADAAGNVVFHSRETRGRVFGPRDP